MVSGVIDSWQHDDPIIFHKAESEDDDRGLKDIMYGKRMISQFDTDNRVIERHEVSITIQYRKM